MKNHFVQKYIIFIYLMCCKGKKKYEQGQRTISTFMSSITLDFIKSSQYAKENYFPVTTYKNFYLAEIYNYTNNTNV